MRNAIIILFCLLVCTMGLGFYLRTQGNIVWGDRVIGITILTAVFVLMPMFLYHRWKNRKVQDYMLTKENIEKMRNYEKENKNSENQ